MDLEPSKQLHPRRLTWAEILDPTRGGPGESPGRDQAVERAKRRSADRAQQRVKPPKKRK